jgi:hypothetical protein
MDGVEIVLGFARTLRHAGVPATPDRVQAMLTALDHLDVGSAADTYWAGRLTLCGRLLRRHYPSDAPPPPAGRPAAGRSGRRHRRRAG